jgi:hypothetical protein
MDGSVIGLVAVVGGLALAFVGLLQEGGKRRLRDRIAELEQGGATGADADEFERALERMERRMKTLEAILDDEAPGWRRKYE